MTDSPEYWTIEELKDGIQVPFADPAGMRPTIQCSRLERTAPDRSGLAVDLDILKSGRTEPGSTEEGGVLIVS